MKLAIAGLLTQQTFYFSPNILSRANNTPIIAISIASDRGIQFSMKKSTASTKVD